jgi:hypothetical protein
LPSDFYWFWPTRTAHLTISRSAVTFLVKAAVRTMPGALAPSISLGDPFAGIGGRRAAR